MPKAPVRGGACQIVGGRKYIGLTGYYNLANGSTATKHYVIIPESDDGEVHVQIDRELVKNMKNPTSYEEAALIVEHPKLKNEIRLLCKHLAEIKMGADDVNKLTAIFTSTLQGAIAKNTGHNACHRGVYTWDAANQSMGL
jgi:hypothetical protein